jgi:hypothetical protein
MDGTPYTATLVVLRLPGKVILVRVDERYCV